MSEEKREKEKEKEKEEEEESSSEEEEDEEEDEESSSEEEEKEEEDLGLEPMDLTFSVPFVLECGPAAFKVERTSDAQTAAWMNGAECGESHSPLFLLLARYILTSEGSTDVNSLTPLLVCASEKAYRQTRGEADDWEAFCEHAKSVIARHPFVFFVCQDPQGRLVVEYKTSGGHDHYYHFLEHFIRNADRFLHEDAGDAVLSEIAQMCPPDDADTMDVSCRRFLAQHSQKLNELKTLPCWRRFPGPKGSHGNSKSPRNNPPPQRSGNVVGIVPLGGGVDQEVLAREISLKVGYKIIPDFIFR